MMMLITMIVHADDAEEPEDDADPTSTTTHSSGSDPLRAAVKAQAKDAGRRPTLLAKAGANTRKVKM